MEFTSPVSEDRKLDDCVLVAPESTIVKNLDHENFASSVEDQNTEHEQINMKSSGKSETALNTVNQSTHSNESTSKSGIPMDISRTTSVEQSPEDPIASTSKAFDLKPAASSSNVDVENQKIFCNKVELYGPEVYPKWYNVKGNLVTPPIIATNLPEVYKYLPIFSKPKAKENREEFYSNEIKEFVGFDLNDKQFESVANYCSPEHLKNGKELVMSTPFPTLSVLSVFDQKEYDRHHSNLCIVKKHHLRLMNDPTNNYQKRIKYRGIRLIPLPQVDPEDDDDATRDLEPGKDLLYHVRIYRPFPYNIKERHVRDTVSSRHSIFSRDLMLAGRARLSALRDRLLCANDAGLRLDCAARPLAPPHASAKELFPSGFLFINNVFYVDERARCEDRSAPLREWARARGLGEFPARRLHATRLDELHVRLGHPEVYVHQGNCEHLFTFSEIRLLSTYDPLSSRQYPCHTAVSQNQSVYCTTCAEFGAKWVVVGCATVPFDPAYFCDTCLKKYLYVKGKPIGDFMCYAYRGNEMNMLKQSE